MLHGAHGARISKISRSPGSQTQSQGQTCHRDHQVAIDSSSFPLCPANGSTDSATRTKTSEAGWARPPIIRIIHRWIIIFEKHEDGDSCGPKFSRIIWPAWIIWPASLIHHYTTDRRIYGQIQADIHLRFPMLQWKINQTWFTCWKMRFSQAFKL